MSDSTECATGAAVAIDTAAFEDALDDVHTRFLLNLPPQELASADRIFFQIEQAWWFYEDLICDKLSEEQTGSLPRFTTLKPFAIQMFQFSPLLNATEFQHMWIQFNEYKRKISTYGTILLNSDATKIVLVQTWTGNVWTLPAGKINQGERGVDAAGRECYEETGFDPNCQLGVTKDWTEQQELQSLVTWKCPLREENGLSYQEANGKRRTFYVCLGVPTDFAFEPVARKEISQVAWFDLNNLPKKSYAVLPLMGSLKNWIRKRAKKEAKRDQSRNKSNNNNNNNSNNKTNNRDKSASRKERDKSAGRDKSNSRRGSKTRVVQHDGDPLVDAGLANVGEATRWSEDEMFKANEQLLGRKVDYDGNPHVFAEKGFAGNDPHAFRVVGGSFMNSGDGLSHIAPDQQVSKYQPLVNPATEDRSMPLTPFFSQDGATPWGEVVAEAKTDQILPQSLDEINEVSKKSTSKKRLQNNPTSATPDNDIDVLTDSQITQKSQERYYTKKTKQLQQQYDQDMEFINKWVSKLPNPVNFRIQNVDSILQRHFG